MASYRVTKYNPVHRAPDGTYQRSEWTSVSDVGYRFGGTLLTWDSYVAVESAYVDSVRRIMAVTRVTGLRATDVESRGCDQPIAQPPSEGEILSGSRLEAVIRSCLREQMWCRLVGDRELFVHFGYDYYMYVGLGDALTLPPLPDGIFAEQFESPYQKLDCE